MYCIPNAHCSGSMVHWLFCVAAPPIYATFKYSQGFSAISTVTVTSGSTLTITSIVLTNF